MAQTVGGELLIKQHLQGALTHSQYTPIYSHNTNPSVQLGPSSSLLHRANTHSYTEKVIHTHIHTCEFF